MMTLKSNAKASALVKSCKDIGRVVIERGGVLRTVEDQGIRDLPHRFKAKFTDRYGVRYHEDGRFVSLRFDASPTALREVERFLNLDEEILRYSFIRPKEYEREANNPRFKKNPFLENIEKLDDLGKEKEIRRAKKAKEEDIKDYNWRRFMGEVDADADSVHQSK